MYVSSEIIHFVIKSMYRENTFVFESEILVPTCIENLVSLESPVWRLEFQIQNEYIRIIYVNISTFK